MSLPDALSGFTSGLGYLKIAVRALRGHLFRSFLTTLSILIGGFSIVLMSSLAASGLATLSRGIEDLGGSRLIFISGKAPQRSQRKTASYTRGMTFADRDALFAALPHVAAHTMYAHTGPSGAAAIGGHFTKVAVLAADASFFDIYQLKLSKGRPYTAEEDLQQRRVCVVGPKVAERLFDGDAVGKWLISSRSTRCLVIGQLSAEAKMGINMGIDWPNVVLWPLVTMSAFLPETLRGADFMIKTDDVSHNDIVKRVANAILVERHSGVDDFELFDLASFMEKWHQTIAIMEGIVAAIAGIALLVGGVGVMNMMLVSVSERVREIGIRKALGASPGAIRSQFLWEAMLLSGSGGVLGVVLGIAAALGLGPLLRHLVPTWVNVVATGAALNALVVSFSIGLLFGYFPARRAARLDAIAAMRR